MGGGEAKVDVLAANKTRATLQADVISYNSSISACGKAAQWQRAVALLDEMRNADTISHNAVLNALGRGSERLCYGGAE